MPPKRSKNNAIPAKRSSNTFMDSWLQPGSERQAKSRRTEDDGQTARQDASNTDSGPMTRPHETSTPARGILDDDDEFGYDEDLESELVLLDQSSSTTNPPPPPPPRTPATPVPSITVRDVTNNNDDEYDFDDDLASDLVQLGQSCSDLDPPHQNEEARSDRRQHIGEAPALSQAHPSLMDGLPRGAPLDQTVLPGNGPGLGFALPARAESRDASHTAWGSSFFSGVNKDDDVFDDPAPYRPAGLPRFHGFSSMGVSASDSESNKLSGYASGLNGDSRYAPQMSGVYGSSSYGQAAPQRPASGPAAAFPQGGVLDMESFQPTYASDDDLLRQTIAQSMQDVGGDRRDETRVFDRPGTLGEDELETPSRPASPPTPLVRPKKASDKTKVKSTAKTPTQRSGVVAGESTKTLKAAGRGVSTQAVSTVEESPLASGKAPNKKGAATKAKPQVRGTGKARSAAADAAGGSDDVDADAKEVAACDFSVDDDVIEEYLDEIVEPNSKFTRRDLLKFLENAAPCTDEEIESEYEDDDDDCHADPTQGTELDAYDIHHRPSCDWKSPPAVEDHPNVNIQAFRTKVRKAIDVWFDRVRSSGNMMHKPPAERICTVTFQAVIIMTGKDFLFRLFIVSTPLPIQEKYGADVWDDAWVADLYARFSFWRKRTVIGAAVYKLAGLRSAKRENFDLFDKFIADQKVPEGVEQSTYDGSTMPANTSREDAHTKSIIDGSKKHRAYRWFAEAKGSRNARFIGLSYMPVGVADGLLKLVEQLWTIIDGGFSGVENDGPYSAPWRMEFLFDMVADIRQQAGFPQAPWDGTNNALQQCQGFSNSGANAESKCCNPECHHITLPAKGDGPVIGAHRRYCASVENPFGGYLCRYCYKVSLRTGKLPSASEIARVDKYHEIRAEKGSDASCEHCQRKESWYWKRGLYQSHVLSPDNKYHLCKRCNSCYITKKRLPNDTELNINDAQRELREQRKAGNLPTCDFCHTKEQPNLTERTWFRVHMIDDAIEIRCDPCYSRWTKLRKMIREGKTPPNEREMYLRDQASKELAAAKADKSGALLKQIKCFLCHISFYFLADKKGGVSREGHEFRCEKCRDSGPNSKLGPNHLSQLQAANALRNEGADVVCGGRGCPKVEPKRSNQTGDQQTHAAWI
ncbi:hypothetical protein KVT40_002949 [Elsinoe batatas]|uniref:Uncharacterized protein n=1 Tax=Elsinoe batatas TaxID=2601811 RepID=A0A8K0PKP9_9PEZI|nr:hypothetical protein KVT40_002949 [Elsinoe batatas]